MNATTHPVAPEEIMAYLDGELPADHIQFLSSHVDTCAECRALADSLRNSSQSLCQWTVASVPVQLEERIQTAAAQITANSEVLGMSAPYRRIHWLRKPWVLGLTGTAALGFFLLAVSNQRLYGPSYAPQQASDIARQHAERTDKGRHIGAPQVAEKSRSVNGQLEQPGIVSPEDRFEDSDSLPAPPPPPGHLRPQVRSTAESGTSPSAPMIARTVSLSVVVKDFDAGRAALDAILARHNGYAARLNVGTPQGSARTLQASLRIPAQQLAAALAELKALGRFELETQNGEEVTQQHADLVVRLKNSRETEQRLQAILMQRTGKISDVLSVEQEIARVRGEIEQMEAEQQTLEHRVDFATIDLKLAEEYKAQLSSPAPSVATQLRNASVNGFRNAFESLLVLVLFFAESGPTLLLWAFLLCVPAWLLWRRYRRSFAMSSSI